MKIGLLFEYGSLNGGEHSMLAVLDVLCSKEIQVVAFVPPVGPLLNELKKRGIPTVLFDVKEMLFDEQRSVLQTAIEQHQLQLLHANSLAMGRKLGKIAPHLEVPTSTHLRDIIKLKQSAVHDLNQHQLLFAVSEATREHHVAQGVDPSRIHTSRNGVDTLLFQPRPKTGWLKRELKLSADSILVATVGQICLRKGQCDMAGAAVLLQSEFPNLHFLLIGERHSQKLESIAFDTQITATFHGAGMTSKLHRLGYCSEMHRLLNELDLLIHPARQEPLGRVLLEAASSGVPIVASNVGGTPEILTHQQSATLVEPNNHPELAKAISELLTNQIKRENFSKQARLNIQKNFSIDVAAKRHLAAWKQVIQT